ncbi:MAG: ribonuclease P protein component [Thermaurantiacus sp.]
MAGPDRQHPGETRPPVGRIRARRDFLAANRGERIVTESFILLVRPAGLPEARAGFTVSKKIGNAVARNRARRRLREVARHVLPAHAIPGADHVFIARPRETEQPFAAMCADAERALARARDRLARRSRAA